MSQHSPPEPIPSEEDEQERTLLQRMMPVLLMWGLRIGILLVLLLMILRATVAVLT